MIKKPATNGIGMVGSTFGPRAETWRFILHITQSSSNLDIFFLIYEAYSGGQLLTVEVYLHVLHTGLNFVSGLRISGFKRQVRPRPVRSRRVPLYG